VKKNRRFILTLCILLFLPSLLPVSAKAEDPWDAFDTLRLKWKDVLNGGAWADPGDPDQAGQIRLLEEKAAGVWESLQTGEGRKACDCLWTDLTGETRSGNNVVAYERIRTMALAYSTRGSHYFGEASLRSAIIDALEWNYANRYNENTARYDNWYHWEMSAPRNLMDTIVLLYDELTAEQIGGYLRAVKAFSPDPNLTNGSAATGANRVEKAWVYMLRGVLAKDGSEIALARDALSDNTRTATSTNGLNNVFAYTPIPEADGMHEDGSFLQHGPHPYIGNYGTTFFQLLANAVYLLDGSAWEVTDPSAANLFRWVYDSFAPTLYKGGQMDMFRGRLISNSGVQSHVAGHRVIQGVMTAMLFAPPADAAVFAGMVKAWVTEDTFRPFLVHAPLFYSAAAKRIVNDAAIQPYGDMAMNKVYTQSDRVVHRRPGFAFGISMSSSRVFRYESINGNNLHGWRTGDGATYLYNGVLGQYDEDYWATVDPYRLSGITADIQPLADRAGQSTKTPHNWVGGVSNGEFGVAGMQFNPYGTSLTGHKSWFMFDDEIVALGTGISSSREFPVETIMENRRLDATGSSVLTVDGVKQSKGMDGAVQTYDNAGWAHLTGPGPGSDIGYYFPNGGTVKGARTAQTGTWGAIQGPAETEPITRSYQRLWFEHGTRPAGDTYAYVLLPGMTAAETERYAGDSSIQVLSNTPEVQAVREGSMGIVGANFWTERPASVFMNGSPWITSRSKASVMTEKTVNTLNVTVSDPTQTQTEPLMLEIHQAAEGVLELDPRVKVLQLSPTVQLSVDPVGAKGASLHIKLALTRPDADQLPPSTPAQLSAAPVSKSEIRLSWLPSTDNSSVAGYEVFRNGVKAGVVYSPSFQDTGLAPNTSYSYSVAAFDPVGLRSAMSETVRAVTIDANAYLIRDDFNTSASGEPPPGYTFDLTGGTIAIAEVPDASDKSMKLTDTAGSLAVVATKPIGSQSEPVRAEFRFMLPAASSYHSWNLQGDGTVNAVTVMTSGGNLIFKNSAGGDTVLQPYSPQVWYTIAILADPVTDRANIYVNGSLRASGVPFRKPVASLNNFSASTGTSGTGVHYLDDVIVYPFTVWAEDSFDHEAMGAEPRGYTLRTEGGSAVIAAAPGASGGSLKLHDTSASATVAARKSFLPAKRTAVEFDILLSEESGGFFWSLQGESGVSAATIQGSKAGLIVQGAAGSHEVVANMAPNTWHSVKMMVDAAKNRYSVFFDGRKAAELELQHPVPEVSGFLVSSGVEETGTVYTDNVKIYPYEYLIDDDYNRESSGQSPSGYVLDARGGPITISETPTAADKSLKFEDSNSRASVATKTFFTQYVPVVAEFDVMLPSYSTFHSWNLKDQAGTNGITVMSSNINNRHVFTYKNSSGGDTVIQPYSENTWYRFKIIADPVSNRFSLYVNGELKVIDQSFRYSVSHFAGFAASTATGGSGTFYMDNLKVYPGGLLETLNPVITVGGGQKLSWPLFQAFQAPEYKADSISFGDVTSRVAVEGNVDTSIVGDYTLRYNAQDPAGRKAREVSVTVSVYNPSTGTHVSVSNEGASVQTGNAASVYSIRAKVWDADGDKVKVTAAVGGIPKYVVLEVPPRTEPALPNVEFSWSGAELPEGEYRNILVTADDAYGSKDESAYAGVFLVDKTPPVIRLEGAGEYTVDQPVKVTCTATDTVSGVTYSSCEAPLLQSPAYQLIPGEHRISAYASDAAGNQSTAEAVVTIRVTREAVSSLIRGWVSGPGEFGLIQSMNGKLEKKQYDALIQEVRALRGNKLTEAHADLLIRFIQALD
jgi:hypothetical protein